MKYECIPFFCCDSHLQEGFFEISSHHHEVKCPLTNRSKAYSAAGNQCLDIPLGMLHHSKPGWRCHIQLLTLYLLHFQVRHPCEEYRTLFLRRWVGRVQLNASNYSWITALHSSMHSDFSSFQTRFACIRGLPSLLVLKGKWFTFPRESCLVQSLVATLQLFFGFFVDNSLISCRWICYPRTSGLQNFS